MIFTKYALSCGKEHIFLLFFIDMDKIHLFEKRICL